MGLCRAISWGLGRGGGVTRGGRGGGDLLDLTPFENVNSEILMEKTTFECSNEPFNRLEMSDSFYSNKGIEIFLT